MLLCISTVRTALADQRKVEAAQRKTPKGGQRERTHREEHGAPAGAVKNIREPAMLKKEHRWPVKKKQLEREEARPVAKGERIVNNDGCPGASG